MAGKSARLELPGGMRVRAASEHRTSAEMELSSNEVFLQNDSERPYRQEPALSSYCHRMLNKEKWINGEVFTSIGWFQILMINLHYDTEQRL